MLEFEITDMTCNHCVASITKAITAIEPDAVIHANLDTRQVTVAGTVDQDAVLAALTEAGFTARPAQG